jgi:hypothetical protein
MTPPTQHPHMLQRRQPVITTTNQIHRQIRR